MLFSADFSVNLHYFTNEGLETISFPNSVSSKITQISVCNNNKFIVCLPEDDMPQIFAIKDKNNVKLIRTIKIKNVTAVTFKHNTKKYIALGTEDGDVVIYDTKNNTVSNFFPKISKKIKCLDFTCDDNKLCGYDQFTFFVFPELTHSESLMKFKQSSQIIFLKSHPLDPNHVILVYNRTVSLWDVEKGSVLVNHEIQKCPINGITLSACGKFLITADNDLKISGIDIQTGKTRFHYHLDQEEPVSCISVSPNNKYFAVGFINGTLRLYDITQGNRLITSTTVQKSPINIIKFGNKVFKNKFLVPISEVEKREVQVKTSNNEENIEEEEILEKTVGKQYNSLQKKLKKRFKIFTDMSCTHLEKCLTSFVDFYQIEFDNIYDHLLHRWHAFGDMKKLDFVIALVSEAELSDSMNKALTN